MITIEKQQRSLVVLLVAQIVFFAIVCAFIWWLAEQTENASYVAAINAHDFISHVRSFLLWLSWITLFGAKFMGPIIYIGLIIDDQRKGRASAKKLLESCHKRHIQYQCRELFKSYTNDAEGFGKQQLQCFLESIHSALIAKISTKDITIWLLEVRANTYLKEHRLTINYPENDSASAENFARLPQLLIDKKPCAVH